MIACRMMVTNIDNALIDSGSPSRHEIDLGINRLGTKVRRTKLIWVVLILITAFFVTYLSVSGPINNAMIGPVVSFVVAILAFFTQLYFSLKQRLLTAEDFVMNSALELLEEGYQLIKSGINTLERSRLDWLTAARNIAVAKQMLDQIQDRTKRAVAREKEMLYRLKFRSLFFTSEHELNGLPTTFFADETSDYLGMILEQGKKQPIAESSLVEIYRFTRWPKGLSDPLPRNRQFTDEEIEEMRVTGPRNLGILMQEVHNRREKKED
jgi:hypothetical protein